MFFSPLYNCFLTRQTMVEGGPSSFKIKHLLTNFPTPLSLWSSLPSTTEEAKFQPLLSLSLSLSLVLCITTDLDSLASWVRKKSSGNLFFTHTSNFFVCVWVFWAFNLVGVYYQKVLKVRLNEFSIKVN